MKKIKLSTVLMVIVLLLMIAYYLIQNKEKYRQQHSQMLNSQAEKVASTKPDTFFVVDTNVSVEFLTGKFNPSKEDDFTEVDPEYGNRKGLYLLKESYKAFIKMYYAAQHDGIKLSIISATRNFAYQKGIWEGKWNGSKLVEGKNLATTVKDPLERATVILKYSSMPGTSRHHWGTDIDLNSMDVKYFETTPGNKVYEWLTKNAGKYGFCQPFNSKETRKSGYEEEKWHWSYMPLSSLFLNAYQKKVGYAHINGFSGSETAAKLNVIQNYVLSVNGDCK